MSDAAGEHTCSRYPLPFDDPNAAVFRFDGGGDASGALQSAINGLKAERGFGVLYIPEGDYTLCHTVFIPKAIRLIGFGGRRPLFRLPPNSPDFQAAAPYDMGGAHYMLWFTGNAPQSTDDIQDANPGTFYSAVSNIDFEIGEGNPCAAVIRAHFAQHCFVSHCRFDIGDGLAGIVEVGNEMEDLCFVGGEYGIIASKPSPGWPFFMADSTFVGQRRAAIISAEGGFVLVRIAVRGCPIAVDCRDGFWDKLYIEDSCFEDLSDAAIGVALENNAMTQINLRNVCCRNVQTLSLLKESGRRVALPQGMCEVERYTHGVCMDGAEATPELRDELCCRPLDVWPELPQSDLDRLPPQSEWRSVREFGAAGDGATDDTEALRTAARSGEAIFFPEGFYLVSDTVTLADGTAFVGMDPISTRIVLADDTPAFAGFGAPKALVETSRGSNVINGLAIDTAGRNPRAVGCRWTARDGYMNDVKFYGGHGGMLAGTPWVPTYNSSRTGDANDDYLWDSQYWSLWIDGGGGVFKDVWSASPYAEAGVYLSDTSLAGRMYCVSVEHHVRAEIKLKNVRGWRFYAMQTEEELAEGPKCQPFELVDCADLLFAGMYIFRVVWVDDPFPQAILDWGGRSIELLNVHNYTQTPYAFDDLLREKDSGAVVRPWELARLVLNGGAAAVPDGPVRRLADGFTFARSVCTDSHGSVYFCDDFGVYRHDPQSGVTRPLFKLHLRPLAVLCDTRDDLVVVAWRKLSKSQQPPWGAPLAPDAAGSSYHGYMRDREVGVYACDPSDPEGTMRELTPTAAPVDRPDAVYYPAHLWHDYHDYQTAVVYPHESFYVAPDGVTLIADTRDLMRSACVAAARPGKSFYSVNEYDKRVYRLTVGERGQLADPQLFCEVGEFGVAHGNGRVYVSDGCVWEHDEAGGLLRRIELPDRPAGMALSPDGRMLYVAARSAVYAVKL